MEEEYELKIEDIEKLIREAEGSGYPVVSLLSDGSIGHYFDKNTTEMDGTHPLITLESIEVIRYFDDGSVSWDDFVLQYAQEIYDDFDWNAEEQ